MRAIVHHRYGGPEVLSIDDVATPIEGDGDLLIRVEAVEACKSDAEMRSLRWSVKWFAIPMRVFLGWRRPRNPVLGIYFAGVVEAVGADIEGVQVGDAVYGSAGMRRGAYAEYLKLSAKAVVVPKPNSMTFAEAAAVPLGAINGLHFVRRTQVRSGDRVLVNGAGGVIGAYAIQAAAAQGAEVTGVDAAHKEAFVRAQGAVAFIDYRTTDVTDLDRKFDVIIDMVPTTRLDEMLGLLVDGGRYAHGNPRLSTLLRARWVSRRTGKQVHVAFADETREILDELARMVDEGTLFPIVDRVLPMEQAAEAHRLVDSEERIGAVVIAIGEQARSR